MTSKRTAATIVSIAAVLALSACSSPAHVAAKHATHAKPVATTPSAHVLATFSSQAQLLRYADGSMWEVTANGALDQLSPTGKVSRTLVTSDVLDAQFKGGKLFALSNGGVSQLDPATGHAIHIAAFSSATAFAMNGGVADIVSEGVQPKVTAITVATDAKIASVNVPAGMAEVGSGVVGVAPDGSVWLADGRNLIHLAKSTLKITATYPLPVVGDDLAATSEGVFVASGIQGAGVYQLAPNGAAVTSCWRDGDALQIVPDGADLWLSAAAGLTELDAATCAVVETGTAPDQSSDGLAVSPTQVWIAFADAHQIETFSATGG